MKKFLETRNQFLLISVVMWKLEVGINHHKSTKCGSEHLGFHQTTEQSEVLNVSKSTDATLECFHRRATHLTEGTVN